LRNVSRGVRIALWVALGVGAVAYPWLTSATYYIYIAALTVMYAGMATSWNIMGGMTGYISLGHAAFFGLGGYITGLATREIGLDPFFAAVLLAGPIVVIIAIGIGYVSFRARGASYIIVTIALVYIFSLIAQGWRSVTGGSQGLRVPRLEIDAAYYHVPFYYAFLIVAALALFCWWWIDRSKFGMGLKAIREDEDKAESMGVPTNAYKISAFAISAFFVSVNGGIYAYWAGFIDPIFVFAILISAYMVLMSLLGGTKHLLGPLLGAVLVVQLNEFMLTQLGSNQVYLVVTGVILGLVVLIMPDGIIPKAAGLLARRQAPSASIREKAQGEAE
jgi:branched-chain amino acid transport system permease protein